MIKQTRITMGMPITLIIPKAPLTHAQVEEVFDFFTYVDATYSPYIDSSLVSKINAGEDIKYSGEFTHILALAEETKRETEGYFDVWHNGTFDPSGIVKGWAIAEAAKLIQQYTDDFYIEAGGDIQVGGVNEHGESWKIGVRNPFDRHQTIKIVQLASKAVATSGTAIRGQHIYDPINSSALNDVVSISVIANDIIDADRMATAAFAMGPRGIYFIEQLDGYEACAVMNDKTTVTTTGWHTYEVTQ